MSFGVWIEDESLFEIEKMIHHAIRDDDVTIFRAGTERLLALRIPGTHVRGQEFLMKACTYRAFACAELLLNKETAFVFDVNCPTHEGFFPLHHAASNCDPGMLELLMLHGANPDLRAPFLHDDDTHYLPLHTVLVQMSVYFGDYSWRKKASVYQIISLICLQRCQRGLECVELLAHHTTDVDSEFLHYASKGKLFFLAALLAVARERLTLGIQQVRTALELSHGSSLEHLSERKKINLALLLDLFESDGDELEEYLKERKWGVTVRHITNDVADILEVQEIDTDLTPLYRNGHSLTDSFKDGDLVDRYVLTQDDDAGMNHHGQLGHRWREYERHPRRSANLHEEGLLRLGSCHIPTEVGLIKPLVIPCFIDCDMSAVKYVELYKSMVDEADSSDQGSKHKRA